jgi:hypothetical protein
VGFEPTHISVVEIQAGLKSTALDHSAIVSDGEIDKNFKIAGIYTTQIKQQMPSTSSSYVVEQQSVFERLRGNLVAEAGLCGVHLRFQGMNHHEHLGF